MTTNRFQRLTVPLILLLISITLQSISATRAHKSGSERRDDHNNKEKQLPPLGRPMREQFLMNPDFVLLDHGAYGTYPKAVQTALRAFQDRAEGNIDLWIRREAQFELDAVRNQLAELVNAAAEDIVMVPNTTSGMNAIFRSMVFAMGERILHFSSIYNSMGSLIKYICDYSNGAVTSLVFNVTFPLSNDQLITQFENFLDEAYDPSQPIRLALIDHITSVPAMILPIEELIPILKQRNITVLIDGAHAIGQIPINIQQLAPDYYITNCHKWLYAVRGCAMMFVDKKHQSTIHPAHINSGYSQPANFQKEFFWTGTMDFSSYMTVTAALQFRREVGGEEVIRNYTHNLAIEGGKYLASRFVTNIIQDENQIGNMVDVRLPINNPENPLLTSDWWIDTLLYRFTVYASPYKHNGQWWVRFSAQIYNDLEDFETAANVFLIICEELNNGTTTIATN